jgi:transposase-like protein
MSKKRSFTPEFKVQAVELAIEQGNVAKTAKDLGIGGSTLAKWVRLYKEQVTESGSNLSPADASKVKALEKENLILRKENEFLKKAAAFFAKTLAL